MKALVFNSTELQGLLDLDELRETMRVALISLSSEQTQNISRIVTPFNSINALGIMPAVNETLQLTGYKAVTVFPDNSFKGINPHQGVVILLDHKTGHVKCIMDGSTITALRTAAVSALATDVLSCKNSNVLAIVGAGRQAYEHIRAIGKIRQLNEIRIFARDKKKAVALIHLLSQQTRASFVISDSAVDVVKEADIIVTCTPSREPFFETTELKPGAHVNAIGACRPGQREIEIRSQIGLKIYLDSHNACINEADEIFRPLKDKQFSKYICGEIGEVLAGHRAGRVTNNELTIFKSVGLAVEDVFAADLAYRKALNREDLGVAVEFS